MVRVYSKSPAQGGADSLGGIFENFQQNRQALDYDDLLNQKRRDEQTYRSTGDPFGPGGLKGSQSDGFLSRVAPVPPAYSDDLGLQEQLDTLSGAISRLQGYTDQDDNNDHHHSKSYPTSASMGSLDQMGPGGGRKTWSAPNKDPFGPDMASAEQLQREMDRRFGRGGEIEDPLVKKSQEVRLLCVM